MKGIAPSPPAELDFLFSKKSVWIMGVLNATPDSFYPGSRATGSYAPALADKLAAEYPDLIDVGAESTRPGSLPVTFSEEYDRLIPLVEYLRSRWPRIPISVDTQKADIAHAALSHGAAMINDVSSMRADPKMAEVVAQARCPVVLMHMRETPATMQAAPVYKNVIDDVRAFFEERLAFAETQGIARERIILDPGIGFGKTLAHNLELLRHLERFVDLGCPLLVGLSRKSFLGFLTAEGQQTPGPEERLEGSLAAGLWAAARGASGLRVHDVRATRRALRVWESIEGRRPA